jgi:hypothetical protein
VAGGPWWFYESWKTLLGMGRWMKSGLGKVICRFVGGVYDEGHLVNGESSPLSSKHFQSGRMFRTNQNRISFVVRRVRSLAEREGFTRSDTQNSENADNHSVSSSQSSQESEDFRLLKGILAQILAQLGPDLPPES